jgi:8-oxo-dGTP diphosphatase
MTIPAVGAVISDEAGRILLVQRAHEPAVGRWSLPGGRVERGESRRQALVREVKEETGLDVVVVEQLGSLVIAVDDGASYDVVDFRCRVVGGAIRAGDDAADVRWFQLTEISGLSTSPDLLSYLTDWSSTPTEDV